MIDFVTERFCGIEMIPGILDIDQTAAVGSISGIGITLEIDVDVAACGKRGILLNDDSAVDRDITLCGISISLFHQRDIIIRTLDDFFGSGVNDMTLCLIKSGDGRISFSHHGEAEISAEISTVFESKRAVDSYASGRCIIHLTVTQVA